MKRQAIANCMLATVLASGTTAVWAQGNGNGNGNGPARPFSFAAIGDVPYSPTTGSGNNKHQVYPVPAYDGLINKINASDVAFTVHIGDIKEGNSWCEDSVYTNNLEYFNKFTNPLIFTPGDNEWTDCHRATNNSQDPIARLAQIRALFYPHNKSLGQNTIPLFKDKGIYVENSSWEEKPAMFIALNQPGSNNNRGRSTGLFLDGDAEYTARNASNMEFLEDRLKKAKLDPQIKLVVIASQANPFERYLEPATPAYPTSGYADFIAKIREFVANNPNKRVLYIHGDTHTFRTGNTLTPTYPGGGPFVAAQAYPNFTRLEVYAQDPAFTNWAKVSVNPDGTFAVSVQTAP